MQESDSLETPQRITKRWLWRLALVFLLALVGVVVTIVILRANLSRKIARALAAAQSAGYAVSLDQVEKKYYPDIDSEKNAAPFFQNAFASLHVTNFGKGKIPELYSYQSTNWAKFLSETNLDQIAKVLGENQEAIGLLRESPPATNCRYPIMLSRGYDVPLWHLRPVKDSACLLSLSAVVQARNGNTVAAVEDLRAAIRVSDSLVHEPVILSQLTRFSSRASTVASIEYALNLQQFSDAQLIDLSRAFGTPADPRAMQHALAFELWAGATLFRLSGVKTPGATGMASHGGLNIPPASASAFNKLTGFFDRDYLFFIQITLEHMRVAGLPFPQRLDAALQLDNQVSKESARHYYILSRIFLPSQSSALDFNDCAMVARLNIVQTALAVERFRLANQNRLPEKLSDLVPVFLDAMPDDPFDGKPLRYKKLVKGYMVYSIGQDRKDDGGVYANRSKEGAPSDITFVVER